MGDVLIELSQNIKLPFKYYQVVSNPYFPSDAHPTPDFHSIINLDSIPDFYHVSEPLSVLDFQRWELALPGAQSAVEDVCLTCVTWQ